MAYANRAPKGTTILVALAFTLLGILGTFLGWLPEALGVLGYVVSFLILLFGIFLRRL